MLLNGVWGHSFVVSIQPVRWCKDYSPHANHLQVRVQLGLIHPLGVAAQQQLPWYRLVHIDRLEDNAGCQMLELEFWGSTTS